MRDQNQASVDPTSKDRVMTLWTLALLAAVGSAAEVLALSLVTGWPL